MAGEDMTQAEAFSDAADVLLSNLEQFTDMDSSAAVAKAIKGLGLAQLAVAAQLGEIAQAIRDKE